MNTLTLTEIAEKKAVIICLAGTEKLSDFLGKIAEKYALNLDQLSENFTGKYQSVYTVYPAGSAKLILIGAGKSDKKSYEKAIRRFVFDRRENLAADYVFDWQTGQESEEEISQKTEAVIGGFTVGFYHPGELKSELSEAEKVNSFAGNLSFLVPSGSKKMAKKAANRGIILAEARRDCMRRTDTPPLHFLPENMAEELEASARKFGYKCEVFRKKKLEALKMEALLAVGRASDDSPTFSVLEYRPENSENCPTVGLVGKGITFDSGGLSIKTGGSMRYMKCDMAGAAAIAGTFEAAVRLKLPVNLVAVIPSCENLVGSKAFRPGEVIGSYSGKSIEIIDTDAEGRLVLADGLAYLVKNFSTDYLIDAATLTGACIRTLGGEFSGIFSRDDEFSASVSAAGERSGERVWRLPLGDFLDVEVQSDVADVKNFHDKPVMGASAAARFLEEFTDGKKWLHIDLAGPTFGNNEFTVDKSASGYGPELLVNWLENLEA